MEAKEHVFLFAIPLAVTILLLARLDKEELQSFGLQKITVWLTATIAALGLSIGAFGFIISAAFKTWLAGFTGHHWVTKSLLSLIIFAVFYFAFRVIRKSASEIGTRRALMLLQMAVILGFAAILGFYIYEFFVK